MILQFEKGLKRSNGWKEKRRGKRIDMKRSLKNYTTKDQKEIEKLIKENESEISSRMEEEKFKKVSENFQTLSDTSGSLNCNGMWALKKKHFPSKCKGPIIAKKNGRGKLITSPLELKKLYLDTFVSG